MDMNEVAGSSIHAMLAMLILEQTGSKVEVLIYSFGLPLHNSSNLCDLSAVTYIGSLENAWVTNAQDYVMCVAANL